MHRFFYPSRNIVNGKIIISDKEEAHHIKDVLRLKLKDEVIAFDEHANEYLCAIERISQHVVLGIKSGILPSNKDKGVKITIACAIPKKAKMDDIVDKLTQLGVARIIPLLTERVVVKLDKHKKALRFERWKKIALSALKQSGRKTLPVIEPVTGIKELLSKAENYDLKLIPNLSGERQALREILGKKEAKNILALIGPEGDFTAEEVNLAQKAGFLPVTLGDIVLRVDTAAISIASFIKLFYEKDR